MNLEVRIQVGNSFFGSESWVVSSTDKRGLIKLCLFLGRLHVSVLKDTLLRSRK